MDKRHNYLPQTSSLHVPNIAVLSGNVFMHNKNTSKHLNFKHYEKKIQT